MPGWAGVIVAPEQHQRDLDIMARLQGVETWSGEFLIAGRDGAEMPAGYRFPDPNPRW